MKRTILQVTASLLAGCTIMASLAGGPEAPSLSMITSGFYLGLGGSWNGVRKQFSSNFSIPANATSVNYANDSYTEKNNLIAPMLEFGYWGLMNDRWLLGAQIIYKYLDTVSNGDNVLLLNASRLRAAANENVLSRGHTSNELLLLAYFGRQFQRSYAYFGFGAFMLTIKSSIIFNNIPAVISNGTFDRINTVLNNCENSWGWAAQLGYNYYFTPTWFLGVNYTYAATGTNNFNNTALRRQVVSGGPGISGANNIAYIDRNIKFTVQEFMFSINKVFAF